VATGRERQARYRERHRARLAQEERARRERERVLALYEIDRAPCCCCCGETHVTFLVADMGRVLCLNCQRAWKLYGFCGAHGPGIRLR
jgi:hypothetical protein